MRSLLVVNGWNCADYVQRAINSIKAQSRKPDYLVIVDDGSTDDTFNILQGQKKLPFHLIRLASNYGTNYARDFGIKFSKVFDYDVIIMMDLDDELKPDAIEKIMDVYENDSNCWLTYGNFIDNSGRVFFDDNNIKFTDNNFRQADWKFIHVRTFKKELYFKLTDEDLFVPNTPIYNDANMLYCLLEMAGLDRIRTISDVIYKYNHDNPESLLNRFRDENRRNTELNMIKSIKPKKCV